MTGARSPPLNSKPYELIAHEPREEEEGDHVGGHKHVEDALPVVVRGQGTGQQRPDGRTDGAGAVDNGSDGGEGLLGPLQRRMLA